MAVTGGVKGLVFSTRVTPLDVVAIIANIARTVSENAASLLGPKT
jgi:hypothetical protein